MKKLLLLLKVLKFLAPDFGVRLCGGVVAYYNILKFDDLAEDVGGG